MGKPIKIEVCDCGSSEITKGISAKKHFLRCENCAEIMWNFSEKRLVKFWNARAKENQENAFLKMEILPSPSLTDMQKEKQ